MALGQGTHAAEVAAILGGLGAQVRLVDERDTTYLARARYFADNPPRGWRRLVPLGMLLPPRPIDQSNPEKLKFSKIPSIEPPPMPQPEIVNN